MARCDENGAAITRLVSLHVSRDQADQLLRLVNLSDDMHEAHKSEFRWAIDRALVVTEQTTLVESVHDWAADFRMSLVVEHGNLRTRYQLRPPGAKSWLDVDRQTYLDALATSDRADCAVLP